MKNKKKIYQQKIAATLVVFFMLVMVYGSFNTTHVWAIGSNTTLQAIVGSGTLTLDSPTQVNFAAINVGVTNADTTANIPQLNIRDARGSGSGWTVVGAANSMQAGNGATISNARLRWAPGSIFALDGASNAGVTVASAYVGNFADGVRSLASATANNGTGNFVMNGTIVNLTITPATAATTYQNTLTITIS
jgi:hypothetical protein